MNTMHESNGPRENTLNRAVSCVATTALACVIGDASAQCQYSVQAQTPWACTPTFLNNYTGTGLNNLGGWCGHRKMCWSNEGEGDVAVYCPPGGSPAKLAMPPNAGPKGAKAYGVNDSGVVVGEFSTTPSGTPLLGCVWYPDGTVAVISPAPGATTSLARAVNNAGFVTGMSGGKAYIWNDGVLTSLPTTGGTTWDISDAGHVVGYMPVEGKLRAFRWFDGQLDVLAPVAGYEASGAYSVNENGIVAGFSETYLGPGLGYASMATVWEGTDPIALPLPTGYVRSAARGVNSEGVVVGSARTAFSSGSISQVVWVNGQPHHMNDLTTPGSPSVGEIVAVNESGQILSGGSARIATPMSASPADLNGDCAVNGSDLMLLLSDWGPRDWSVADLNHDGVVNGADLAQLLGNWTGSK